MIAEKVIHKNIRITGRVQGVGFRYSARSVAFSLGIKGYVRNISNGDVYIEAEGTLQQLENLIAWCRQGPSRSKIKMVDIYDGEVVGFEVFEVK
jgi:acylphosphatase